MTRQGAEAAIAHAETLPAFASLRDAESALYQLRDKRRAALDQIAAVSDIALDYSADSLKTLEKSYFTLCETDGFNKIAVTREQFEHLMGIYSGWVYTENNESFQWIVEESHWIPGRYSIAVSNGFLTRVIGPVNHLHKLTNNKRMQSMYREYKQYSST